MIEKLRLFLYGRTYNGSRCNNRPLAKSTGKTTLVIRVKHHHCSSYTIIVRSPFHYYYYLSFVLFVLVVVVT